MTRRVAGSRRKDVRTDAPSGAGQVDARPHDTGPAPAPLGAGEPDLVVVGRVGRPQGIKGEVTVEVRTDDPDARFAPGATLVTDEGPLTVAQARDHSGRLVVLFDGVADRNAAELLRGRVLQVDARTLPALDDEDEFYDSQLVGIAAATADGQDLGHVKEVLHLPHGDVLVLAAAGREHLVPFVKAIVPTVDLAAGRLVVAPPPGLLDLGEGPAGDSTEDRAEDRADQHAEDAAADEPEA